MQIVIRSESDNLVDHETIVTKKLVFSITLSWRRPLPYRNQTWANQWTGFYMIGTSAMKKLKQKFLWNTYMINLCTLNLWRVFIGKVLKLLPFHLIWSCSRAGSWLKMNSIKPFQGFLTNFENIFFKAP